MSEICNNCGLKYDGKNSMTHCSAGVKHHFITARPDEIELTKDVLSKMTPAEIAPLNWDVVKRVLKGETVRVELSDAIPERDEEIAELQSAYEHSVQKRHDKYEKALTTINALRNDIIGRQSMNWSAHIYPLVAALNEAGFEGEPYEVAKEKAIKITDVYNECVRLQDELQAERTRRIEAEKVIDEAICDLNESDDPSVVRVWNAAMDYRALDKYPAQDSSKTSESGTNEYSSHK